MLFAAIATSDDIDIAEALIEVISDCRRQLSGRSPQAGILFTSCMDADFEEALEVILREFPGLQLIGCTSDGEITPATGFIEDSLSLLLLTSDSLHFATAIATDLSGNTEQSLRTAYLKARRHLPAEPSCAFLFPDGMTILGIDLGDAIHRAFGGTFPVFGGSAGDHYRFAGCYQFHGNKVYRDAAPVLLISGPLCLASAIRPGPVPIGSHFPLGRHHNNIVHEIDGKRALDFYREHLGEYRSEFSEFPLAVYEGNNEEFFLRDPFSANEEDGSLTFIGTFPDTCTVRLTLVSRDDVLEAARNATQSVLQELSPIEPELVLIFPCTWIRHILGSRANETFTPLRRLNDTIPFFGFYCYGEIAPTRIARPSRFHNDTYVIVALSSRTP